MGDDRPPAYWEDGTLVIRASSLGGPICQLVAAALGNDILPPPGWLQKAFDAGNHWEGPILEELRRRGWRDLKAFPASPGTYGTIGKGGGSFAQQEFDWPVKPGVVIRFHPDDVLLPVGDEVPTSREVLGFPEGPVIVEAKALSAANYEVATRQGAEALPYAYDWQLAAMMHGLGLPAVWVTVDKSAKEPKPGLGQHMTEEELILNSLHAQWVARPPISKAGIVRRVVAIEKLIAAGDIPTDEASHGANPCRFLYLCPQVDEQQATVHLSGERGEELARWAQWYEQQKELEKLAKQRREEAREQLLELVGDDSRVSADGWVVGVKTGERKAYEVKASTRTTLTVGRAGA